MKNKIILRTMLIALVSIVITYLSIIVTVSLVTEYDLKRTLISDTLILKDLVEDNGVESLKKVESFGNKRVTVVSENGSVAFDSDVQDLSENHAERQEIKAAFNGKSEVVKRYSQTKQCDMLYYAVAIKTGAGSRQVIRTSIKSSDAFLVVLQTLPFAILALGIALLVSYLFAGKLSRSMIKRVENIQNSLKSINDGEYRPIETTTSDPEFYGILNETNELFARTNAVINEMESEKAKTKFVLNSISQSVVALNDKNEIALINQAALTLFNANESVVGKSLVFLISDNALLNDINDRVNKIKSGKNMESAEVNTSQKKPQNKANSLNLPPKTEDSPLSFRLGNADLSLAVAAPNGDENHISAIVIISDITQEKMLIKQKSEFFANASHELKTPLTSVQGLSELLIGDEAITGSARKYVERIHSESLRLNSLILDMLKLSSLENQVGLTLNLTKIKLEDIAGDVIASLSEKAKDKNITTSLVGGGQVEFDQKKLFELIENLYSNAINYNVENGTIQVRIDNVEGKTRLQVEDSGIGIDKKSIPRLCERFFREDKSHSKKTGGTGLGLAIVKYTCALFDCNLNIESEKGKGTIVTIVFA